MLVEMLAVSTVKPECRIKSIAAPAPRTTYQLESVMNITNHPLAVWVLQPSYKPVEVTLVKRYYEGWHAVASGKTYHEDRVFSSKVEAVAFGRGEIERMRADITKRQAAIEKKVAALDKSEA